MSGDTLIELFSTIAEVDLSVAIRADRRYPSRVIWTIIGEPGDLVASSSEYRCITPFSHPLRLAVYWRTVSDSRGSTFGGRDMSGKGILNVVAGVALFAVTVQAEVVIETVTVGNPGNAGELSGDGAGGDGPDRVCGAVDYVYDIGKFEVTAAQYTEFLNAVAATDTYGLYSTDMGDPEGWGCYIRRSGSSGSYSYSVEPDWADRPLNFVSWGDTARFCNWLHNGQPTGAQDLTTTEDGSYYLNGATSDAELMAVVREPDATWVMPSEDEWYKAAYHCNDGVTGNYYEYPMSTDTVPNNGNPQGDTGNSANFADGDYTIGSPYWRTEVGYFGLSGSPYGTFDQGGNVWEWNEATPYSSSRGLRGGSFNNNDIYNLHASYRYSVGLPTGEGDNVGFRVARTPRVVIETVTVGNPGNTDDTHGDGYGGVDYVYNIGKFEITAGQYTEFLNAVAGVDIYGLYNADMWSSSFGCKIERFDGAGTVGDPYQYRVAGNWANRPVNYVSWGHAARFCNWLHNGQPIGLQGPSTTEDGSYFLDGAISDWELTEVMREPDATWVIPSEDEWYKAAYHCNDGVTGNYYDFPTSSDSVPSNVLSNPSSDPGNNANFYESGYTIGSPYYRTEAGDFENSESPYGTFDQGGNGQEWNEAVAVQGPYRGMRGGSFDLVELYMRPGLRADTGPASVYYSYAFRVADVSSECGNGVVEFGEECDDGNEDDTDFCLSTCETNRSIPTVSEWGLVVMTLLVLTAGTVVLTRRRVAATCCR
ncbi:MAG: IPTL-CTERM sorting domain-containing protein [Phycisphaerae bacterium]